MSLRVCFLRTAFVSVAILMASSTLQASSPALSLITPRGCSAAESMC